MPIVRRNKNDRKNGIKMLETTGIEICAGNGYDQIQTFFMIKLKTKKK